MTNNKLRGKMAGALAESGMSMADVARKTGMAYSTVTKAFREPKAASIARLMRIWDCIGLKYSVGGGQ